MKNRNNGLNLLVMTSFLICGSIVSQYSALGFVEPAAAPPAGNVTAPITAGAPAQTKEGALTVNTDGTATEGLVVDKGEFEVRDGESSFSNGTYSDPDAGNTYDAKFGGSGRGIAARGVSIFLGPVGIVDLTPDGSLDLDVDGDIGAEQYCDEDGDNCYTIVQLAGGTDIDDLGDAKSNTTTSVFLGTGSGIADTGTGGTAVGINTMSSNTTGIENTAVGRSALQQNTTGGNNTAIGSYSLAANTTVHNNTAIGAYTLEFNSTGDSNTTVGSESLRFNTSGGLNASLGWRALNQNTEGFGNTALGYQALTANVLGSWNAALGVNALQNNINGQRNVAIGFNTLPNATNSNNTAIGGSAGEAITTGGQNTLLGNLAGDSITSGSQNIIIGYGSGAASITGSQQLSIGNLIYGTGLNGTNNIVSTGNIGIGENAPARKLHVSNPWDDNIFRLEDSNGICDYNPGSGSVAVTCSSDRKLKSNIYDTIGSIAYLNKFRVRDYTVIASNTQTTGVIAQEVQSTHPELVSSDIEGTLMVEQPNPWRLVAAIQELFDKYLSQQGEIDELRSEIDQLKADIENLR